MTTDEFIVRLWRLKVGLIGQLRCALFGGKPADVIAAERRWSSPIS